MEHALSDLRILKLAELYESAYETFILEMAEKHVRDEAVRSELHKLAQPSGAHGRRVADAIQRLNARLGPVDRAAVERAALLDVLEVERNARAFYMRYVEEIHDPEVAALFRALAREERWHIRIVEDALALSDRKAGRPHLGDQAERALRLLDVPPALEREGVGRTRLSKM